MQQICQKKKRNHLLLLGISRWDITFLFSFRAGQTITSGLCSLVVEVVVIVVVVVGLIVCTRRRGKRRRRRVVKNKSFKERVVVVVKSQLDRVLYKKVVYIPVHTTATRIRSVEDIEEVVIVVEAPAVNAAVVK